ncbi:PREDICTED: uncharacterized protein LOC108365032 isoform X2 [Rhagoletis zephyria]|uniref:uncharacterized protein LOC108365032 isoform X2 n=1 Tax=Rhagoletis zephyria TaxID=28612 RepID=UPI000811A42F|nr:PREDICTED: uncharacterized protein LOC108365032 isoform X2 [Rhagoletis zephyria]
MSFAFKIDKALKANLYKICRLCGIDREEKVEILDAGPTDQQQPVDCDGELKLHQKIIQCIGITISKDDKMPQSACVLCVDKINDFYEFREMCYATDVQTRKLLGLKRETQKKNVVADIKPIIDIKEETVVKRGRKRKSDEVVAKEEAPEVKRETNPVPISSKKQRLNEAPTDAKKKGKLGKNFDKTVKQIDKTVKQIEKTVKPKEEIKEEPAENVKPTTAPSSVTKFRQVCNICNQRFGSKVKLEQHVSATHVPNIPRYVCTACNETIKKTNDIKSHQLWHKLSKTPYMCGHCGQSLISSYAYSRHLRDHTVEIPPNLWVLDRECPQCHHTFLTNFLYNTHSCAVKTKKCAGCNRQLRNEVEYQRHAAHCNKVYLNYSKHIPAAAAAAESTIRIKNENDVEAAAAEALARNAGISLDMAPVVSLTRISTPEIIAASQGNSVAEYNNEGAAALTDDPKTPAKKGGKKGVSRKDLKRVDNLLKSTLDALVSIKHEPEVHVETDAETPAATGEETANKEKESEDTDHDNFHHDDFHHGDNNDDEDDEGNRGQDAAISTRTNEIAIKEEPVEENISSAAINIKQEVIDVEIENTTPAAKMPVLKLKIKKEHGTLNSSIVEEQNIRVEKKKKKKKRKDAERKGDKMLDGNEPTPEIPTVQESEATSQSLSHPNILRPIKQERLDEAGEEMEGSGAEETVQPGATVMTTIPIPQFQISAISSGVEFGDNTTTAVEGEADVETSDTAAVTTPDITTDEGEMEDIKPNRAELDRLFKITSVSSGVQMEREIECTYETASAVTSTTTSVVPGQAAENSITSVGEMVQRKAPRSAPKAVKHKAPEQKPRPSTQARAAKAFKSTSGVSKNNVNTIVTSNESNIVDYAQIKIKPEPVDRGYEDVFNAYEAATNSSEPQVEPLNEGLSMGELTEQEYLNNIDFSTIQIKQEKDLDLSDVEMTNTHIVTSAIPNGMKRKRSNGEESQYSGNEEDTDSMDNEETEDDDDDDEDDDDDDDWVGVKKEEEEKREYRELEMPPLLSTEEPETPEIPLPVSAELQGELELPSLMSTEEPETSVMPPPLSGEVQEAPELPALLSTEQQEGPQLPSLPPLLLTGEQQAPELPPLLSTEGQDALQLPSILSTIPERENVYGEELQCELNRVSFTCPNEENMTAISAIENAASTLLTDNSSKSTEAELPPPFMITGIYSQANCGVSNQFSSLIDRDSPLVETGFSNAVIELPIAAPTFKISSVMAGCSVNFNDFSKHAEEEAMSEYGVIENLSVSDVETMQVDDVDENGGTNLLDGAAHMSMTDESMDFTSTAQTLCLEINQDKDSLLNAQPFSNDGSEPVNALNTMQIMFNPNTNVDMDISIQPNPENVVEEAQNVLNHEVVEAQAIQRLTLEVIEATQNVEETENLMNECVAEAQLQQQQAQYTETPPGSSMRLNDPECEKSCSSSNESIGGAGSSSGSGIGSASGSIGALSQSTLINRPFMLDDSNINEIAENNNNANIEREQQDDVSSTNIANTFEANVVTANPVAEQSNAAVVEIKTEDIT